MYMYMYMSESPSIDIKCVFDYNFGILKKYIRMVLMIKVMIHNTNGQVKLITF